MISHQGIFHVHRISTARRGKVFMLAFLDEMRAKKYAERMRKAQKAHWDKPVFTVTAMKQAQP